MTWRDGWWGAKGIKYENVTDSTFRQRPVDGHQTVPVSAGVESPFCAAESNLGDERWPRTLQIAFVMSPPRLSPANPSSAAAGNLSGQPGSSGSEAKPKPRAKLSRMDVVLIAYLSVHLVLIAWLVWVHWSLFTK